VKIATAEKKIVTDILRPKKYTMGRMRYAFLRRISLFSFLRVFHHKKDDDEVVMCRQ
jgi:hypothetical protein